MKKNAVLKSRFAKYVGMALLSLPMGMTANAQKGGKAISTDLFGIFFEDINYSADGGLYGELVENRSFEYSPSDRKAWNSFTGWEYDQRGYAYGTVTVETTSPINANNPHYVVLNIEEKGEDGLALVNYGFDGIVIKEGDKYDFSMFARQLSDQAITLNIKLVGKEDKKDVTLAETSFSANSKDWKKYSTTLTATKGNENATLIVTAQTKGKIALDMVSLFPEKTFKNHKNGLRADLAQTIANLKPRFIRFPGGCLVHGDGLENMYRWKNTIGNIEERKSQRNIWGYHQTAGLGFFEYFQFCEDIGAKPLPVLPAAVSCQNSGGTWRIGGTGQKGLPMSEMQEYIQEVLDLVEYANGAVTTTWGAKRAQAGHPAPFNLEYIGIANEEKITPEFNERFKMIYDAVKAKYPNLKIIGTAGPAPEGEDFEKGWKTIRDLKVPMVDEHYYMKPEWFLKNQKRYDTYKRTEAKVYIGEYASQNNLLFNAICEAAYMTSLERNGDIVQLASYAPLLAKEKHVQWNPDMIYFTNTKICLTPNYYVQQLFMQNSGDTYFEGVASLKSKVQNDTTFASSCVRDSKTGDIIVKVVNASKEIQNVKIDLSRFKGINENATCSIVTGNPAARNTYENPTAAVTKSSDFKASKIINYDAPAFSLSVFRMKTKK